ADCGGRPPESLPLRAAVQEGHRAAAAPVRDPAPRRASQAAPAGRKRVLPGRGRRKRRLLGSEPVLPSLQTSRRCATGAVPDVRKNRLTGRKSRQETPGRAPYDSSGAGLVGAVAPRHQALTHPKRTIERRGV